MFAFSRRGAASRLLVAALLVGLGTFGCGKQPQVDVKTSEDPSSAQASAASNSDVDPQPQVRAAVETKSAPVVASVKRDRLHQAFNDATLGIDNPPPDAVPVSQTLTGKSGPKLCEQVAQMWDSVRFTTADNKQINYSAEIVTSHGTIRLLLLPELSPNHVRNFIVLARLGYYDGLCFDRIHKEKFSDGEMDCIEAGCPLGTGSEGTGSLGYWLKDEFTPADKLSHTAGVVGACRAPEADTAATKFYINLNSAAFRDGQYSVFARVVEGLDVARTISQQAVVDDPLDGGRSRPKKPVVIQKVIVHEVSVEASKK